MRTRRAERVTDPAEEDRLRTDAARDLREALALTAEGSIEHAQLTIALARVEGPQPLAGNLDAAIKSCRKALRRLVVIGFEQRDAGRFAMAQLLELRANLDPDGGLFGKLWPNRPKHWAVQWLWPERCVNDLAVATYLYFVVSTGGDFKDEARRRFPVTQQKLAQKMLAGKLPSGRRRMFEAMYANQLTATPGGAVEIALTWAGVAMDSGNKRQAAQAWWSWITAVSSDLRRRVLHDKESRLGPVQSLVATAAWWMFDAGHFSNAAITLELGRAVLLTERVQRAPGELEGRLRAAGQEELADRWREAGEALHGEDRARLGTGPEAEAPTPLGSLEYHALVEHEWLLREISELDGFPDIDATPGYDDLRAAASEGPLVYLATTSESGFALVVTADAPDAIGVRLPYLTRAVADSFGADLRGTEGTADMARALRDMLPELDRIVMAPLMNVLPRGSLVTLIATGLLGALPLHAAGREDLVFRYAPNARVLMRSQRIAGDVGRSGLRVLTAAAARAAGERELRYAEAESRHVARLFGPAHSEQVAPATVDGVQARLDGCTVWHFACHGVHDPALPLYSRLLLRDGWLDLRAIFSRPGGVRRLAVLSACQTANVDGMRPDEVIGFPGALLQAGLAGVLSCQGEVDDAAAMLLVLRFFETFTGRPEVHPARALAIAQEWLRTSTNGELAEAFPDAYLRPLNASPRWESVVPFAAPGTWALFNYTGA